MEWLLLALAVLLVLACGVFVAGEFSLLAADRNTIEAQAAAGDRRAVGVQKAFTSLSTQLSGVQLGITVTNLAIGFLAEPAIATIIDGPLESLFGLSQSAASGVALVVALVLATGATMLFGELVPKNFAIALPVQTAKAVQGFVRGFAKAVAWPIRLFNGTANAILHRFGLEVTEELASARGPDELRSLVRRSASQGTLDAGTAALVQRSLAFGDKRAGDVLTPRTAMRTLPATATVTELIEAVTATGHSRFPVVGVSSDDVVGLVHVKHAVGVAEGARSTTPVTAVMVPPVSVPSTVDLDSLLDTLQVSGLAMAVVVDEFGGTDGVVTIEDLIEELVGEVRDEHDRYTGSVRRRPSGAWSVPGLLRPDEVTAATGITVAEGRDYDTLAGLLVLEAGRIPERGDVVEVAVDGEEPRVRLTVERMDGRRVERILLEALEPEGDTQSAPGGSHGSERSSAGAATVGGAS